jgi:hypothetical protein
MGVGFNLYLRIEFSTVFYVYQKDPPDKSSGQHCSTGTSALRRKFQITRIIYIKKNINATFKNERTEWSDEVHIAIVNHLQAQPGFLSRSENIHYRTEKQTFCL